MGYRTVVISNRCKLNLKMGYMEVRAEETKRVYMEEIDVLIIENPAVSLTGCLLSALIENKVKVIFCDEKRNPQSELIPLYGSHDSARKLKTQLEWNDDVCGAVWTYIVGEKIRKQSQLLKKLNHISESELLESYIAKLTFMDETNREGHAAKVYFNALFGKDFTRNTSNATNAALNYGYSLILSIVNREIVANGFTTQLGLFHDNIYNHFNLSSDLMEPFRIVVDMLVESEKFEKFEAEEKHKMLSILQQQVEINNTSQILTNAIRIYVKSILDALTEKDLSYISFYEL